MTADLEFIPWTPTADLAAAIDLVDRASHPNAGILVDTLHFDRSHSSLDQIDLVSPDIFRLIQLCDAPGEAPPDDEAMIQAARAGRSVPGQGGLDLEAMVEALPKVPYSLEVPNEMLRRALGDDEFAKLVLDGSRRFVTDIVERERAGGH